MSLALDRDQVSFAGALGDLLDDLPDDQRPHALTSGDRTPDTEAIEPLWRRLALGMGVTGLPLGDDLGGADATWREVGVVLEALGAHATPLPYVPVMLAVRALERVDSADARSLLSDIVKNGRREVLAVDAARRALPSALPRWESGRVTGTVPRVLGGDVADGFVCLAEADGTTALVHVEAATARVAPQRTVDLTRHLADVQLDAAPAQLLSPSIEPGSFAEIAAFGAAAVAAESVGGADRCLAITVDYVKLRHQFGQVIGGFQALKHTLADVVRLVEPARAAVRAAFEALATGEDPVRASTVARLAASEAFVQAAGVAVQLHGAIGFTWEHELQLHLKRAMVGQTLFGSSREHRLVLAEHLVAELAGNDGKVA